MFQTSRGIAASSAPDSSPLTASARHSGTIHRFNLDVWIADWFAVMREQVGVEKREEEEEEEERWP